MFPAKVLHLNKMLNGPLLSLDRVSDVQNTSNSTVITATASADDGSPAEKRRRVEMLHVPSNGILVQVIMRQWMPHQLYFHSSAKQQYIATGIICRL